jgi:UDP-glucose 4-epimerase
MEVVQAQIPGLSDAVAGLAQVTEAMQQMTAAYQANVQATQALAAGFSQIAETFATSLAAVTAAIENIPSTQTGSGGSGTT